jgi:hypothetical protein
LLAIGLQAGARVVLGVDRQRDQANLGAIGTQSIAQGREGLAQHRAHAAATRINKVQIDRPCLRQLRTDVDFRAVIAHQHNARDARRDECALERGMLRVIVSAMREHGGRRTAKTDPQGQGEPEGTKLLQHSLALSCKNVYAK